MSRGEGGKKGRVRRNWVVAVAEEGKEGVRRKGAEVGVAERRGDGSC